MKTVDANVLLYSANRQARHHERATRWLRDALGSTDAHPDTLALELGAEIVTFDRDLLRFGVKVELLT